MSRKSNTQSLKEAIEQLLSVYKIDRKLNELDLIEAWNKIMGPMIEKRTTNIYIKDQTLHVTLNSSTLREELSYAKSKIISNLNEAAGQEIITDLVLK